MNLTDASSRIALAALLHDLGKLAERAGIDHEGRLDAHKTLYCPWHIEGGYHSHIHAAYTGIAWDVLEATGHFPDLRQDCLPFSTTADDNATDSAVNAASAHHRPDTYLQWIVATADRVASGFERDKFDSEYNNKRERENHYCARLLTLFEQIGKPHIAEGQLVWCYPLKPLAPEDIFPQAAAACTPRDNATAKAEYHALWEALLEGLKLIPQSHVANLPLWLDHFDSLWLAMTHAIPAATAFGIKPEVSLYDHSKAAAALATALWRWHHENGKETVAAVREGWAENKIPARPGRFLRHSGLHLCRRRCHAKTRAQTAARSLLPGFAARRMRGAQAARSARTAAKRTNHQRRRQIPDRRARHRVGPRRRRPLPERTERMVP